MKKVKLDVIDIQYAHTQTGAYALLLEDTKTRRRIPIIIGANEAQSIAIEKEKLKPNRPLTHDLFKPLSEEFGIKFTEVIIYNLVEGVFYAKIICTNGKREIEIDARTSDAVAIAMRFQCPIYTYEFIISEVGILIDEIQSELEEERTGKVEKSDNLIVTNEYSRYTDLQLEELLQGALQNEEYEKASNIRDELKTRKK